MILITGSNGFLGQHLSKALELQPLSLLDRNPQKHTTKHRFTLGSIDEHSSYYNALNGCDTVIHCAARVHVMDDVNEDPLGAYREVNTFGTLNLARQAVEAGVKRFIFISTIKVNGETSVLGSPFTHSAAHDFQDYYGQSKSEAEFALKNLAEDTGLEVVIIRPTLVYGMGVKANFAALMSLVNKGIPLPFGCISNNQRSLVSVTNLVDLIVTCIGHPNAVGQVFLVSDGCDVSTSEMVECMAVSLNKSKFQIPVPKVVFRWFGKLLGKRDMVDRLLGSLQVDITHTKKTLDWTPPQTLQEGFSEAASLLLNSNNK